MILNKIFDSEVSHLKPSPGKVLLNFQHESDLEDTEVGLYLCLLIGSKRLFYYAAVF